MTRERHIPSVCAFYIPGNVLQRYGFTVHESVYGAVVSNMFAFVCFGAVGTGHSHVSCQLSAHTAFSVTYCGIVVYLRPATGTL